MPESTRPGTGSGDLGTVLRFLGAALGPDADAVSLADALWLAAAPTAGQRTAEPRTPARPPAPREPEGLPAVPPGPPRDAPAPRPATGTTPLYERLPSPAPQPPRTTPTLRIAPARALPEAAALGRALRPFKRRYPRGRYAALDIEATVREYGRHGELVPVLAPQPEPWFDVLLVVDSAPAMAVWKDTVREFTTLLAGTGAFRRIDTWHLGPDGEVTDRRGRAVAPGRGIRPDGRRLVLVVSDCASPAWRGTRVWRLLRRWCAATPTVLLNPLPPRLWHRTALDLPAVRVTQRAPAQPNALLDYTVPPAVRALYGRGADWLPLPTLGFTAHSLGRWARTFMRTAPHGYEAVLVPSGPLPASPFEDLRSTGADPTDAFLHGASPAAARLAALCSPLSRLSVPMMRVVRQELVPEATLGDLAEVLTSGLVTVTGEVVVFDAASRERLSANLTRHDAWLTHDTLSRHVATHRPPPGRGPAATTTPDELPPDLAPFAHASAELLNALRVGVRAPAADPAPAPAPTPAVTDGAGPGTGADPGRPGRLPDPDRSAALLIRRPLPPGRRPGRGRDEVDGLSAYLESPDGWDLAEERCLTMHRSTGSGGRHLDLLQHLCQEAQDTVLLYVENHRGKGDIDLAEAVRLIAAAGTAHVVLLLGGCALSTPLISPLLAAGRFGLKSLQMLGTSPDKETARLPLARRLVEGAVVGLAGEQEFLSLEQVVPHGTSATMSLGHGPAWTRNVLWHPPTPGVPQLFERLRESLSQHLKEVRRAALRPQADRLLLALLLLTAERSGHAESAPDEDEYAVAQRVRRALAVRGITAEAEAVVSGRRWDLVWQAPTGPLPIAVEPDSGSTGEQEERAPASAPSDTPVVFRIICADPERIRSLPLSDRARVVAGGAGGAACTVALTLPMAAPAPDPYPEPMPYDDTPGQVFRMITLPSAVRSVCDDLVGREFGGLAGTLLSDDLARLTVSDFTLYEDSIEWNVYETYEYGLELAEVRAGVGVTLEGVILPGSPSEDWPQWGTVHRTVVLVLQGRKDLSEEDVDLELTAVLLEGLL